MCGFLGKLSPKSHCQWSITGGFFVSPPDLRGQMRLLFVFAALSLLVGSSVLAEAKKDRPVNSTHPVPATGPSAVPQQALAKMDVPDRFYIELERVNPIWSIRLRWCLTTADAFG